MLLLHNTASEIVMKSFFYLTKTFNFPTARFVFEVISIDAVGNCIPFRVSFHVLNDILKMNSW